MKGEPKARGAPLTPLERARELARRVIAVPKTEIDKQESEWQKARKRKRA